MNAQEAHAISAKNLKGPVIEPYMQTIYLRIEEAAKEGKFKIYDPYSRHDKFLDSDIRKAIDARLQAEGYTVKWHEDPDPGHPCSSDYTTVEW